MRLDLNSAHDQMVFLKDAVIIPPQEGRNRRETPSGVLDSQGLLVEQSLSWTTANQSINQGVEFSSEPDETLDGSYVFGGIFYGHFGHFIVESLARIWALDKIPAKPDGVLFNPKTLKITDAGIEKYSPLMQALGLKVPIKIIRKPTRVSELYVPKQGFGMNDLSRGSSEFREFINRHAGQEIKPEGSEKLYISRSRLLPHRGSIIGERKMEEYLEKEGYDIFHPQRASTNEQIARYKAARWIIAEDCSPLHLLGYVGDSHQNVAIIKRRSMEIIKYIADQLKAFKEMRVIEIDCLINDWMPHPSKKPSRSSWGEVSFSKLHEQLYAAGFLSNAETWSDLTDDMRMAELARLQRSHQAEFKPYKT